MSGHLTNEDLVLLVYGETSPTDGSGVHLRECELCRAELDRVRGFLDALPAPDIPEPGQGYEERVWRNLRPALPQSKIRVMPKRFSWRVALAAAAVVVLAFLAGRATKPSPALPEISLSEKAKERILAIAVIDHLERSRVSLTEWQNLDSAGSADLAAERQRAEDLVQENRLYRQTAALSGDASMTSILDELERVLLDIAHSPANATTKDIHRIQQRIDEQGTLFKVRVARESLRQDTAARARL